MKKRLPNMKQTLCDLFESNRILVSVTVAAFILRLCFFGYQSADYTAFLQHWFAQLKQGGGFAALGQPIGDYMVTYLTIMAALTYLPLPPLVSIKLVSCLGDVVLAWFVLRLVTQISQDKRLGRMAYAAMLFFSSAVINSGVWAQCDAIYTAGLVACVLYAVQQKPLKCMVALGVAFAFKLQTVFLAPFILFLLLKKRIKIQHALVVPAVYLVAVLPAWVAGRPLAELLMIYLNQTQTYSNLSLNAPNFYAWFGTGESTQISMMGVLFTGAFLLIFVGLLALRCEQITDALLLKLALFSLVMMPFLLPHMHERYFYPADCLGLCVFFLFAQPARRLAVVALQTCSFLVVCQYFGWVSVSTAWLSLPMLGVFLFCLWDTATEAVQPAKTALPQTQKPLQA